MKLSYKDWRNICLHYSVSKCHERYTSHILSSASIGNTFLLARSQFSFCKTCLCHEKEFKSILLLRRGTRDTGDKLASVTLTYLTRDTALWDARALIIYHVVIRTTCPLSHLPFRVRKERAYEEERERKRETDSQGRSVWAEWRDRKSRSRLLNASVPSVSRIERNTAARYFRFSGQFYGVHSLSTDHVLQLQLRQGAHCRN